jgi:hypothetical protein
VIRGDIVRPPQDGSWDAVAQCKGVDAIMCMVEEMKGIFDRLVLLKSGLLVEEGLRVPVMPRCIRWWSRFKG